MERGGPWAYHYSPSKPSSSLPGFANSMFLALIYSVLVDYRSVLERVLGSHQE